MVARKGNTDIKLYTQEDVESGKRVTVRLDKQLMQDINLLLASHRNLNLSDIVKGSVNAQADAVRERAAARWTCHVCGKRNGSTPCVICETDRPDSEEV